MSRMSQAPPASIESKTWKWSERYDDLRRGVSTQETIKYLLKKETLRLVLRGDKMLKRQTF
jgi:hypothetical protein